MKIFFDHGVVHQLSCHLSPKHKMDISAKIGRERKQKGPIDEMSIDGKVVRYTRRDWKLLLRFRDAIEDLKTSGRENTDQQDKIQSK